MKNTSVFSFIIEVFLTALTGCSQNSQYLNYSLRAAGENRSELRKVICHYRTVDKDFQKLEAAKYLIMNMPAHYSYRDTASINSYYRKALEILGSGPGPDWQRDTLRQISDTQYSGLTNNIISDVEVMTADYLIYSIDRAFNQWRTRPWAKHLSFEEFRDWVLPYKVTELQSLDAWRDTLVQQYSDSISKITDPNDNRNTIYGAIEIVRNEIHSKQSAIGHRVIWEDRGSIPMRSASTWTRMTYGSCMDYVTMGTAVFRSMGLPAMVDIVPVWGRNSDGHSWYVFLSDRGGEEPTINSLIMPAGMQFYPYERIPKVWRNTFTINRERVKYRNTANYIYPFEVCQQDVTDHYNLTSDLQIKIDCEKKLQDKYVYIAMAVNAGGPQWKVLDFGQIRKGKACFNKMGRNVLYIVLGYDGNKLIPISFPFILHKNGAVEYIGKIKSEHIRFVSFDLRRKYYESYNVVDMRRRILGGKIQCSDDPDFINAITLYTIEKTDIPFYIELKASRPYRYWRYLSPDGSWGSLSELSFYNQKREKIHGKEIANPEAIDRAYDGNLLSNFEINQPDGNWVGLDLGKPEEVFYANVTPRSDDNDICPGNEYELYYFDGNEWRSLGYRFAEENSLHYEKIPLNTLLWLHNYTRGNNERPFILRDNYEIEWW